MKKKICVILMGLVFVMMGSLGYAWDGSISATMYSNGWHLSQTYTQPGIYFYSGGPNNYITGGLSTTNAWSSSTQNAGGYSKSSSYLKSGGSYGSASSYATGGTTFSSTSVTITGSSVRVSASASSSN